MGVIAKSASQIDIKEYLLPWIASAVESTANVLVGIDGSMSALEAAAWAAREAERRRIPLRLVHIVDPGEAEIELGPWSQHRVLKYLESRAVDFLAEARQKVGVACPEAAVETTCITGRPLPTLIALSREALLTVVGSSRADPRGVVHAGSVAVSVSAHGYGPVVVVRGTEDDSREQQRQTVVVGIDSSNAAENAAQWAFEEAALRGADLTAVFSCGELPGSLTDRASDHQWWLEYQARQKQSLVERIGQWTERYPEVVANCEVATGRPAWALMRWAHDAKLVVVGSRGRSEFVGSVLGSTSHTLVHHAPCPVMIVPSSASSNRSGQP
ncbi:universal stress protein [Mycolicibacterium neworleansense]|uniref:universal stress protein n=1 Tax=Mycolicibacterium neworleansense TaxID=146018 RepID=UPI00133115C3|nr:universal stress protein [Mycolicibacterium neworleansense]MCV7360905.1 universal stress protein [Mycolicibacterium neworleansense]